MPTASDPRPEPSGVPRRRPRWASAWWLILLFALVWAWQELGPAASVRALSYSEFKAHVAAGEITELTLGAEELRGKVALKEPPADGPQEFAFRAARVDDPKLVEALEAHGVDFIGEPPALFGRVLLVWLLPLALVFGLWTLLSRRMGAAAGQALSFGKSKAKMVAATESGVTFADVAGCEEAKQELMEVVDFLKNPARYRALGAKIPKGILLVGPPGTGKTLLARAVAGEAQVPFFSLSGSDFVEMFVGVGAARVRDLFEQAVQSAPCIIFIDELDAVGRQRGVQMGAVNDEREQTLNQLLVEMDGFAANSGVILLSATNRPDVLDRALLRPGRFDRQVVLDAPDMEGRLAILRVHTQGKPLAEGADLAEIARRTPGFAGADLANAMNEAALLAARRGRAAITQLDLEDAVEKVIAGPERKSRRLREQDRRRIAYHEVGHALVARSCDGADPVRKVSIIPRGQAALGYTLQIPAEDQLILTRGALIDRLKGLMGGRAAEQLVFGEASSGAENDLERATALARQMVAVLGMSERLGLARCGQRDGGQYLGGLGVPLQRDCSEQTAREIDEEVRGLLDRAYQDALAALRAQRSTLDRVAAALLERETLDEHELDQLVAAEATPHAPA
ncbi:MAG: ATP-dependent zinc metalloprotease FtsH [Nannocystis sp.]|nr:ATP-dependent zinc metalloprotease FtsH [Nannocystis sp.]